MNLMHEAVCAMRKNILALFLGTVAVAQPIQWSGVGAIPGFEGNIDAMATGSDGVLYIAGYLNCLEFLDAGILSWDGKNLKMLAKFHEVKALAIDNNGNLYAGGRFDSFEGVPARNIAKWNGSTWEALKGQIDPSIIGGKMWDTAIDDVRSILIDSLNNVIIGGHFVSISGKIFNNIARWNGSTWENLGEGVGSISDSVYNLRSVQALAFDAQQNIIAVGEFDRAGTVAAENIASWNGTTWKSLGGGLKENGNPNYLSIDKNGKVYVGSQSLDDPRTFTINCWDGQSWATPLLRQQGEVGMLFVDSDNNLHVDGRFSFTGDTMIHNHIQWNGTVWKAGYNGLPEQVTARIADRSGIEYIAGCNYEFNAVWKITNAGYDTIYNRGNGIMGTVHAIEFDRAGALFAGGSFVYAGTVVTNNIARWDGKNWHPLGSGLTGTVSSMLFADGNLYAAGNFTFAGSTKVNYVARWDGSRWSALGNGLSGPAVWCGGDNEGMLYVLQNDTGIGDPGLVKWDGKAWAPIVSEPGIKFMCGADNDSVYALYVDDPDSTRNAKVKLLKNGEWSTVCSFAVNGQLASFIVDKAGTVYVRGSFDTVDGMPVHGFAKWAGGWWSSVSNGLEDEDGGLMAVNGVSTLFANRDYWTEDSVRSWVAQEIHRWNDSGWDDLGGTISGKIECMKFNDAGVLCIGGDIFLDDGNGNISVGIAFCTPGDVGVRTRNSIGTPAKMVTCSQGGVIRYNLPAASKLSLRLYNFAGREVYRKEEMLTAGIHTRTIPPGQLAKGAYCAQVRIGGESFGFKVTLVR